MKSRNARGSSINKSGFKFLVICSLICFVSGCSTMQAYDGPKLPESEVALIMPFKPGMGLLTHIMTKTYPLVIQEIDGESIKMFSDKVAVKPGEHKFKIAFIINNGYGKACKINLIAEAGHTYMIYGTRGYYEASVWIVDRSTGEEVSRLDY